MPSVMVPIRIADMPAMTEFIDSVASLLGELAACEDDLPRRIAAEVGRLRTTIAALGGPDARTPLHPSALKAGTRDEAARLAQENPGRTVTWDS